MEQSRKYETAKYFVSATGFVLNTGLLIYLLTSRGSFRIRDLAEGFSRNPWVVVLVYSIVIGVLLTTIQIPLDFLSGYWLERRFGLSRQSLMNWIWDQVK